MSAVGSERLTIIVGTSVAKYHAWPGAFDCRMGYVMGLRDLGHDVYLMENVRAEQSYGADHQPVAFEDWPSAAGFEAVTKRYGIWPAACLILDEGRATRGMRYEDAVAIAKSADLIININGKLTDPRILESVARRAYVDEAPGLNQVYEALYGADQGFGKHDYFFTFGLNLGEADCEIPTADRVWHALPPPVDLTTWRWSEAADVGRFTTISNWEGEATFDLAGRYSGEKSDNWRRFTRLPQLTDQELEIALNIPAGYDSDRQALTRNGWILSDPTRLRTLADYGAFISESRAEFSVANDRYVQYRTGWLSDRTARYLASGRPALVQSTGLEQHLPTGEGLLVFSTLEEAAAGVEAINHEYPAHRSAARRIAEHHLDARIVMGALLDRVLG